MAWNSVKISINDTEVSGFQKGLLFSVPFGADLSVDAILSVDKNEYKVVSIVNVGNRNEVCEIYTEELESDKPKTRRAKVKSGESDV
jgi:hypothetical protein